AFFIFSIQNRSSFKRCSRLFSFFIGLYCMAVFKGWEARIPTTNTEEKNMFVSMRDLTERVIQKMVSRHRAAMTQKYPNLQNVVTSSANDYEGTLYTIKKFITLLLWVALIVTAICLLLLAFGMQAKALAIFLALAYSGLLGLGLIFSSLLLYANT
ncbi:MAG: hypothetical protein ACI9VM_000519, partial [Candidatus Azotimanducaceae bacterium]